jgi:Putative F0F1-ATPase subunit Ca2+/Mg2+ transporter
MQPAGPSPPSGSELLGVGGMVAGAVVVPLVAGLALDAALHSGPILTLVGLGLGIVAGAVTMFVRFRQYL